MDPLHHDRLKAATRLAATFNVSSENARRRGANPSPVRADFTAWVHVKRKLRHSRGIETPIVPNSETLAGKRKLSCRQSAT
jgi:hypothetical protein